MNRLSIVLLGILLLASPLAGANAFAQCAGGGCDGQSGSPVGKDAPALNLTDVINGEMSAYEDLKGKVVFLELWSTRCGYCVECVSHIQAIHEEYKDQGLLVLAVTHEDRGTVEGFLSQKKVNYPVGLGNCAQDFGVRGIPHAFLIVDGKIEWAGNPNGNGWKKDLPEYLKKFPGKVVSAGAGLADARRRISEAKNYGRAKDALSLWEAWQSLNSVLESGAFAADGKDYAKLVEDVKAARAKAEAMPEGEAQLRKLDEYFQTATTLSGDPANHDALTEDARAEIAKHLTAILDEAPKSLHAKQARQLLASLDIKVSSAR